MHRRLALVFAYVVAGSNACSDDPSSPAETFPPLVIVTGAQLPAADQDEPYQAAITAEGGTGEDYVWSLIAGQQPAGLLFASRGTPGTSLNGVPSEDGAFRFTLRVEDSQDNIATQVFELAVNPAPAPPEITTVSLPEGTLEAAYRATVTAAAGSGEGYRWSLVQGGLPPGLSFTEEGISTDISGTPTGAGTFPFTIQIQDSKGDRDTQQLQIVIQDGTLPIELVTEDIPGGQVTVPWSRNPPDGGPVRLESRGGVGTRREWSISDGQLPPGVQLSVDPDNPHIAYLSGIPTARGTFVFGVRVQDEEGNGAQRTYFTFIEREPPALRIVTIDIPPAVQNTSYEASITAQDGAASDYQWDVIEGALPLGMMLEPTGTPSTRIVGTTAQTGNFTFIVRVTDPLGDASTFPYLLRVRPQILPITITSSVVPIGFRGRTYTATLTAENGFGEYNWVVSEGRLPDGLELSIPGTPSTNLAGVPTTTGAFSFTVTVYDLNNETDARSFVVDIER